MSDSDMESMSESDLSESSEETNDKQCWQQKTDNTLCFFRGDEERFRGGHQPETDHHPQHQEDIIGSFIPSIIADDKLACQFSAQTQLRERSRLRGGLAAAEEDEKLKHQDKAKPKLPEVCLLQEETTVTTGTQGWNGNNNWNNVAVHQCEASFDSFIDSDSMYSDDSYYSEESF